ncbi:Ca-activated chloride channel family protein [Paracoccus sulfuroxidans]|uniref:Ca-activated chloride channel family protein n=2 Tax=Paracoccus sulfuroxidans TaxID=384678 RepID=A0A562NBI7_9RHOB|nr:VWA domain-containing protein [Paracoccus sulfuroxidans]TWI29261.1 Ca-activated chloride channel family protein [Paracoccus sulfuroxidans]
MTTDPKDELDRLSRALRERAPKPDPAAKRAALARSMENFDRLAKETDSQMRPSQDRPPKRAGFLTGVRHMFSYLTSKQALAVTTSAAALCIGLFIVLPQQQFGTVPAPVEQAPAPMPQPPVGASDEIARSEPAPMAEVAPAPAAGAPAARAKETRRLATPQAAQPQMMAEGAMADMAVGNMVAPSAAPADMIDLPFPPATDSEAFANEDANPVKVTAEEPVSTFSADIDTASYAVVRDSLMSGRLPPAEAVRIEEMVNYFPYGYPAPGPQDAAPFKASVEVMPTPWNAGTQLVRIGLQGRMPAIADRPALNLVFLIDTSGSMQDADKLPLLKQSLRMMLGQLRPEDQVAIVAYAGSAGEVLPPTHASDSAKILQALDRLDAGGSTNGAEGLELAYRTAESMTAEGEVSRILLATDGDFNVGISDPKGLEDYIARKRKAGTYLSVLGFGRGNLDDATMQALAQKGNGQAAYIDTLQEAQKVLVDQLSGALFPIADDVKLQVEWNPAKVAEYRLIGYETRALRREDFNNDKVDAGELGAGHSVTALYEVTAPDSPALLNDNLRYQSAGQAAKGASEELGFLRMRYKAPGEGASQLLETPILAGGAADDDARFAAAIAGFGQLLTGATYLGDWGWDDAIALAQSGKGADPFGYRAEAISLMRLAESLEAGGATATPQTPVPDDLR